MADVKLTPELENKVRELSMAAMRARINGNIAKSYALRGEIARIYAQATGDNSEITGKGANRNRWY